MSIIRRALSGPPEVRQRQRRMPSLGSKSTASGVYIDPERSLQIGAVYACVRLLSESIANLPVDLIERNGDSFTKVKSDPILRLVSLDPNPDIDAAELWRTVMGWMLLRGNAYVYIERNGRGQPIGLWPIAPTSIDVRRSNRSHQLVYDVSLSPSEYAPVDESTPVLSENMMHFRAFGLGVEGLSPIGLARQSVGLGFAAGQYMAGFYARDATPGGHIEVDGELSDLAYERMEKQWKDVHEGWENSYTMAIMEGGAKWKDTTLAPADAQFIETQKFTRSEIASIYGVPPFLIGDTEKSTSWGTGLAEQGIGFVRYGLLYWANRLKHVTRRRLLARQPTRQFAWDPAGLMQGDLKARYDAYAVGKQWGWLSTNDILTKEGEKPVKGGDVYLQPLNMVPAGESTPAPPARGLRSTRARLETAWQDRLRQLLFDTFGKQRVDVHELGRFDREKWDSKLADVLQGVFGALTNDVAERVAASLGGEFNPALVESFVRSLAEAKARNLNITTEQDLAHAYPDFEDHSEAIDDVFDHAQGSRAALAAAGYVAMTSQFATHEAGQQVGARRKAWVVTSPNPRPSHAALNGTVIGMSETFDNGAMWPGDARAGVDEVAGCTCELRIIADDEEGGAT